MNRELCDGCVDLDFEEPVRKNDVWLALCCRKDKPMPGKFRVVAVCRVQQPEQIQRPRWCAKEGEKNI